MAEIRGATYEDKHYDSCGNTTIAVFEHDQVTVPLCANCLEKLLKSIDEFKNTVFCHQWNPFELLLRMAEEKMKEYSERE